jgi:hypothetical protein
VSLLFLQAVSWFVRSPARLGTIALATALLVLLATPVAWSAASGPSIPLALSAYFSGSAGSLFPVFPWAAYVFFEAAAGSWFAARSAVQPTVPRGRTALAVGSGMIAAGLLFHALPWSPFGAVDFWTVSPNLFLLKAGVVLVGVAAAIRLTNSRTRLPGVVTALSRQSLLVYVVHLLVLYHPEFGGTFFQNEALQFGPAPAAAAALALMGAMLLLAWAADQRRRHLTRIHGWARAHVPAASPSELAQPF